jgi:hypothetical protein
MGNPVSLNASGQATFTTSTLTGGTRGINAVYSGDSNFQGTTALLKPPQVVNRIDSSTSLTGDPNPVNYGVSYTFTATVVSASGSGPTPVGDVTFVDTTTGATLGVRTLDVTGTAKLAVDGSSVAFLDAGLHTVQASFPGDNNYNPSARKFTETVNSASTSTSVTNDHTSGSVFGEPVTYTATVTSPTTTPFGAVTFTADDGLGHVTTLGTKSLDSSGKAALSFNALPVGTQTITAAFNANVDFKGSSGTTSETVSQGTTSATLSTSKSPTVFGEPVTFTATITANAPSTLPPAGSVTFVDTTTGATLGTNNLLAGSPGSGSAKATLTVSSLSSATGGMSHNIQASYNTDGNYASSSANTSQTVNPAPTVTTVTVAPSPSAFGQVVTITATVNPSPSNKVPTGSVVFTIDGSQTGAITLNGSGKATATMVFNSLGSHRISAAYTSDNLNNFLSSSSSQVTQQVNAAPTTTTVTSSQNPSFQPQLVTFTATVSGAPSLATPTGSVQFVIDGSAATGAVGLNAAGQATFSTSMLAPGKHSVAATYTSNSPNFTGSSGGPVQTVRATADPARFPLGFGAGTNGVEAVVNLQAGGQVVANPTPIPGWTGEIHRAVGDLNGDFVSDTVWAAGPGGGPRVRIIAGGTGAVLADFFAFDPAFTGGVNVAVADVNGDGVPDVIAAAGPGGGPHLKVIDGTKLNLLLANGEISDSALLASFFAYDPTFTGGVNVAAADINGDSHADIITGAGPGGGPHAKVIDGTKMGQVQANGEIANAALLASFFAFAPSFTGGVNVAAGDFNGDGTPDVIVGAGAGSIGPLVRVLNGTALNQVLANGEIAPSASLGDFPAFAPGFSGGVRVDAVDVNGDGKLDIVTGAGPGGGPAVEVFGATDLALLDSFFATLPAFPGGVFV